MSKLWFGLISLGLLFSFINKSPETVTNVLFFETEKSVELILNLIPVMAFWTGLMRIVEKTNILNKLSTSLKPMVRYLFKDVQHDVKAVNAILMTLAANMLGIGNSATAFGIKAMQEMQKSNANKKTATNAMCMFLIINVSSLQQNCTMLDRIVTNHLDHDREERKNTREVMKEVSRALEKQAEVLSGLVDTVQRNIHREK